MRVPALHHSVTASSSPLEIKGPRQLDVALTAIIDVAHLTAVSGHRPAEDPHIADPLTYLKGRQQLAVAHAQLQQPRVLVVTIKLVKVVDEAGLSQKAASRVNRLGVVLAILLHQPIKGENVLYSGFLLEPDKHVVAEQHQPADLGDIACDAVVLGAHARATNHLDRLTAEFLLPLGIQRLGQTGQLPALLQQPLVQYLVGTTFSYSPINQALCLIFAC